MNDYEDVEFAHDFMTDEEIAEIIDVEAELDIDLTGFEDEYVDDEIYDDDFDLSESA